MELPGNADHPAGGWVGGGPAAGSQATPARIPAGVEFGRLKARQRQFTLVVAWIEVREDLGLLRLFLTPYFRATTYSDDQIGTACCDDIPAAGAMMNRILVGKDLSPSLAISGVLDQAARVRSRWLPRFAQLAMNEPHLTNRHLNLMAFAERTSPAARPRRTSTAWNHPPASA